MWADMLSRAAQAHRQAGTKWKTRSVARSGRLRLAMSGTSKRPTDGRNRPVGPLALARGRNWRTSESNSRRRRGSRWPRQWGADANRRAVEPYGSSASEISASIPEICVGRPLRTGGPATFCRKWRRARIRPTTSARERLLVGGSRPKFGTGPVAARSRKGVDEPIGVRRPEHTNDPSSAQIGAGGECASSFDAIDPGEQARLLEC